MTIQKIKSGRVNNVEADNFVGDKGTIFFNESVGDLRISDGLTVGGIPLTFGGGDGGTYTLPTASTTIKGGVKIDGTTIAINNQVISVGTVPYSSLSGTPTIPTNNNQLSNGAGYITSSSLTGLATETYVTTRGYITTNALDNYALTSAVPTNNNQLSNGAGYITSSALTGYALTAAIPTDISQLTDTQSLLGQGGGGTIIRNVENPFSFSVAGDDSTLREIANGESIKFTGAGGITITTDAEGNVTITGTPVSLAGYATETFVTTRGYLTTVSWDQLTNKPDLAGTYSWSIAADDSTLREISAGESVKFTGTGGITTSSDAEGNITITGPNLSSYALTSAIPTNNNQLSNGAGYITSSSLTGLATESYVNSRGYITGLSWNDLTDKPNLAGTYSWSIAADDSTQITVNADNVIKFVGGIGIDTVSDANGNITINGFSGSYNDLTDKPNNSALNANGTFSMPLLSAQPIDLQAGQIALANGTSWDPQLKNENKPYLTLYTGAQWIDIGGLTASDVYKQVLELT